ncbi:MAG: carbohydrate binding domain-containing protein [Clostridia bacterium]|nr:carbohydrate binding domain-containing protein [Clostridia bacterium]
MKKWQGKKWLAVVLAVMLFVTALTTTMTWVVAAEDAPTRLTKTDFKEGTLADKILKEDGFINGISYQYIDWGRTFSDNQLYGYDTNVFSDGNGAEQVYADMINIKTLGYNAVQIMAGGGKMEGVLFGENGEILGLSDEYKQNFRKYLEVIDATETNIAVILQFHTTIIYSDLGKDAWDKATQYYGNPVVRKQYMDLVMGPILDILKDFEHRLLFLTLGDELENEINDHYVDWNYDNDRANYGVSFENMYQFYSDLNDLCIEKMPDVPRTIAANGSYLHRYSELDLQAIGRNRYSYSGTEVEPISFAEYKTGLPMYFPEWGLSCWTQSMTTQYYEDENMVMLDTIRDKGYFGAFFWIFDKRSKSDKELTMYNTFYEHPSDYSTLATRFAYKEMDYQKAYDGIDDTFDAPVMFAYNGDGVVTWLHSRQGETFTLERSLDGGKTWTALVTDAKKSDYSWRRNASIGYYVDETIEEDQAVLYRVTAKQTSGATRTSENSIQVPPMDNTPAGGIQKPEGVDEDPIVTDPSKNLIKNGDFETNLNNWSGRSAGTYGHVTEGHQSAGAAMITDGQNRWGGIQQSFPIEPGKKYSLSLSYKDVNNLGNSSFSIVFSSDGVEYNVNDDGVSWDFGSEDTAWHTASVTFTSGNYSYARIRFIPGAGTGTIKYIDNVHVECIGADDNMIQNGYFANGTDGWTVWTSGAGACITDATAGPDGSAAAKLSSTNSFTVELSTAILKVEPDHNYVLKFDVKTTPNGGTLGVFLKSGTATSANKSFKEFWAFTSPDTWESKTIRFNSETNEYLRIAFSNANDDLTYFIDNVTLYLESEKPVRNQVTSYIPKNLVAQDGKNLLINPGFESRYGQWDVDTFVDGTTVQVVTDAEGAKTGDKYLRFEGKGLTEKHQAVFYVDVKENTSYTFSAWIRSAGLSTTNNGDVFIGVFDPETGNYLVGEPLSYDAGYQLDFSATRAIKPTAFDNAWHLRGEVFDTADMTRIGIMISGTNAQMLVDDMTLCETAYATAYVHPANKGAMETKLLFTESGCAVEDNLLLNYNLESSDLSYWEKTHGYDMYVTVEDDPNGMYGKSFKYSNDNPLGRYFTKWVDVKPNTDYIFSYSIYVTEDGDGSIGLMDSKGLNPKVFYEQDFDKQFMEDMDFDGTGWITLRAAFTTNNFSRVAIVILDNGGEAYIDNLRLFEADKATEVINDNKPFDAPALDGWVKEEGKWAYYENGVKVTNKWVKDSAGWCYLGADGYAVTNTWKKDSKGWCYLNGSGSMTKNAWVKTDGKWYFLDANGYMVTNAWKKDSKGWVYVGKDGAMLTNAWCKDSKGWCYVGADGYAVTNCWKKDSKGWIWLNASGSMTKNAWIKDNGKWYFLNKEGYMVTNAWMKDSKGWVYVGSDGAMLTNAWCKDSKGWCFVGKDGYAVTNCWKKDSKGWIWLDKNGSMTKSAWIEDGGKWYYLDANGYMVAGKTITISGKKYTFNAKGEWVEK